MVSKPTSFFIRLCINFSVITSISLQRLGRGHSGFFNFAVAGSRHDQNRSGRAHAQLDLLGHLIEVNADRYALGQTDPLKGRTDIRQQVKAGAAVLLGNTPAQAVDAAFKGFIGIRAGLGLVAVRSYASKRSGLGESDMTDPYCSLWEIFRMSYLPH